MVHDGVLQVLALVQRRGAELGGEAAELGALAGEQEKALRTLIRQQDETASGDLGAVGDLAAALEGVAAQSGLVVEVSGPGGPVELPAPARRELADVVAECLANVARHVGADARAWVLVENLTDQVVVTVRDEGPGIPAGRLEAAEAEGRLGVVESIRGRIRDLGGQASLFTDSGLGVEWEFTVPRQEEP
ncbi:sensor histidine kinase [Nocardioides alcanivorans]|uniref:sensor histidine kinase n=1 Tax=Nocardioides alcanivorans TaxID=2897352 RepID=UPI001F32B9FE|nr:ATP-binding protein [Nocardioides alcanivorans]